MGEPMTQSRSNLKVWVCILMLTFMLPFMSARTQAMTASEKTVFDFAMDKMDLSPAAACGIIANLQAESYINPSLHGYSGLGICQWTGTRASRCISFCASKGMSGYSLIGQLSFMYHELQTVYPDVLQRLRAVDNSSSGAYNAAYYFSVGYERPAAGRSAAAYRGSKAASFFTQNAAARLYLRAASDAGKIRLTWNKKVSGKIAVYRSTKNGSGFKQIAKIDGSSTKYTDKTTKPGKRYYYYIAALNKKGKKTDSSNHESASTRKSLEDDVCTAVLSKEEFTYKGKKITPKPKVTYDGKKLKYGRDYTLTYTKNDRSGKAKIKVSGKGQYGGSIKLSFKINKGTQKIKAKAQEIKLSKYKGKKTLLKISATGEKYTLKSSDESILSVKGKYVIPRKKGEVELTIVAPESRKYLEAEKTITITVY